MPSPIAHWAAGLLVCRALWPATARGGRLERTWRWLLPTSLVLSLLPDAASVIGLLSGELSRYHNSWEHSLVAGLLCAAVGAFVARLFAPATAWLWFAMILLCFELHVLMDLFTVGRGVRILWPFSEVRYSPPIKLFYGVHWSDGWFSVRHLWTLLSETALVAAVVAALGSRYGRTRDSANPRHVWRP